MDRLLAAVCAGALVFMAALDAGLPAWRHLPIGDAADLGAAAGFAVWFALKASADTHPKGGDVQQAPSLMGSAVPKADAQGPSQ